MKLVGLVPVWPLTVTVMVPEDALIGTDVVMLVGLLAVTVAVVPLNLTVLLAVVVSKFVPVIVTDVPTPPLIGLKLVTEGGGITMKLVELVPVWPLTFTVIAPVVAPAGTEVVMLVAVLAVTVASVPLNFTLLFAGVVSKFVPAIVTDVPTPPLIGLKLEMVGCVSVATVMALELLDVPEALEALT